MISGCLKIGEKEMIDDGPQATDNCGLWSVVSCLLNILRYFQHTQLTAAEFTLSVLQRYFKFFYFLRR